MLSAAADSAAARLSWCIARSSRSMRHTTPCVVLLASAPTSCRWLWLQDRQKSSSDGLWLMLRATDTFEAAHAQVVARGVVACLTRGLTAAAVGAATAAVAAAAAATTVTLERVNAGLRRSSLCAAVCTARVPELAAMGQKTPRTGARARLGASISAPAADGAACMTTSLALLPCEPCCVCGPCTSPSSSPTTRTTPSATRRSRLIAPAVCPQTPAACRLWETAAVG